MADEKTQELNREQLRELENLGIVTKINSAMQRYKNQRQKGLEKTWNEADKIFHNESIGHYYESQSKTTVSAVHNACRLVAARIRDICWGGIENFSFRRMKSTLEPLYKAIKTLLTYQLEKMGPEKEDLYNVLEDVIQGYVTFGKTVLRVAWGFNRGKRKRRVWRTVPEHNKEGVLTGIKYKAVLEEFDDTLFDGPVIKNVNIFRFWADAEIKGIHNQEVIVEEFVYSWHELWKRKKRGMYPLLSRGDNLVTRGSDEESSELMDIQDSRNIREEAGRPKEYTVWMAFFYHDINHDGEDEKCVVSMLGGKKIIQPVQELPYDHNIWPYVDADFENDLFGFYGRGVPQICREAHINLQDNRRQTFDARTMILNCMWLWDRNVGTPPKYLLSQKNKVLATEGKGGIEPLRPPVEMIQTGMLLERVLQDEIQQASMALAAQQGLPSRYGTTATEASQMLAQSNITIVDVIKKFEKKIIEPMLDMVYALDRQFLVREQVLNITGKDGLAYPVAIRPWQFRDVDFIATGSTNMEQKMVLTNQLLQTIQMAAKLPQGTVNIKNCLRKWYEIWGIQNVDDYIVPDEDRKSISASEENVMLMQGQDLDINYDDADLDHLATHAVILDMDIPYAWEPTKKHIEKHHDSMKYKKQQQEMMERELQMQEMMQQLQMQGGALGQGQGKGNAAAGPSPQQQVSTLAGARKKSEETGAPDSGRGLSI